jgi:hypothetical protein
MAPYWQLPNTSSDMRVVKVIRVFRVAPIGTCQIFAVWSSPPVATIWALVRVTSFIKTFRVIEWFGF